MSFSIAWFSVCRTARTAPVSRLSFHFLWLWSNEITRISEIPNITNEENVVIAAAQGKKPVSILSDELCQDQASLSSS